MNKRQIKKRILKLYNTIDLPQDVQYIISTGYDKRRLKYRLNKHYKSMWNIIHKRYFTTNAWIRIKHELKINV